MTKRICKPSKLKPEPAGSWNAAMDALYARMQTQKARKAVDALFSATDDELNRRGGRART